MAFKKKIPPYPFKEYPIMQQPALVPTFGQQAQAVIRTWAVQKETQYPIVGSDDGVWEETMKLNEEAAGLPKVSAELSSRLDAYLAGKA